MKPIINFIYNRIDSGIDASKMEQKINVQIEKELKDNRYSNLVNSLTQVYITVVINPEEIALQSAYHQNNYSYVIVDPAIEEQDGVYLLQLGLSRITINNNCKILMVISSNPVRNNIEEEISSNKIKYLAVKPKWTFESIILPEDVVNRLIRATKIIKNKNIIFDDLGYSLADKTLKSIICFYGPAGTGKTITAQAIAHYLGKDIVISSYAQIESKYVGEGAKNLRKIFEDAQNQDAVLFMDECDSFLSKRIEHTEGGSDKHYNRMSNELFQLLEDYSGCIIFATNLLTDIDKAFKSRIVDSIYFPLPDQECRKRMLQKMVLPEILQSVFPNDNGLDKFAQELEGFSGRDIRKSILLTLADISDEYAEVGKDNYVWTIEKFKKGFDDVRNTFSGNTDSAQLPNEELQRFIEQKKFKQKQFELAKHAIKSDEGIDDREYELLQELSQQLLNCDFDKSNAIPTMGLPEICEDIINADQKHVLVDTAIRVTAIDGEISEEEEMFLTKLCDLLNFSEKEKTDLLIYAKSMATASSLWQKAIANEIINSRELNNDADEGRSIH